MKIGIAGAGFMGSTHAESWCAAGAPIGGFLADRSGNAERLAQRYGAAVFPSFDALLMAVDVADICTPTDTHAELTIAAARAGRHVVCEKPLARTVEQAEAAIDACELAGVKLLVAHVVRFAPEYALAKASVERGDIGRPAVLRLGRFSYRPRKQDANWFVDEQRSGGIMLDLMIHDLDYARWVAGEVDQVFARSIGATEPGAPFDHALVLLKHAGGAISHIAASSAYPAPTFRTTLEIAGDGGLIEYASRAVEPIEALRHAGEARVPDVAVPFGPLGDSPYTLQLSEFYAALVDDAPVRVSARDGLVAVKIALAAIESARSGRAVSLDRRVAA